MLSSEMGQFITILFGLGNTEALRSEMNYARAKLQVNFNRGTLHPGTRIRRV